MQSRLTGGMPAKLTQGPRTGYDLSRMGAGAARGANRKKKLEAAPWSGTWPAPGATLDLDFANNRGFVRGVGQGGVMDGITFTRASNATYVGEDGLLKGGGNALGKNLLTFPQDFENAVWSRFGATVTANTDVAPDGTLTADLWSGTSSTSISRLNIISQVGIGDFVFSMFIKPVDQEWLTVAVSDGVGGKTVTFNIMEASKAGAGVIGSGAGMEITDYTINAIGNEWVRVAVSFNTAWDGSPAIYLYQSDSIFGTGGPYSSSIWGAQLELGPTATEYYPTNINMPRFDWASTEQVAQKNRLSGTTIWGSNQTATIELDGTVGPFPEDKAVKYTPVIWAANRNSTSLSASPIYSNEICTVSIYAKMNTLRYVTLGFVDRDGVGGYYYDIVVDLSNGNITQVYEYIAPASAAYSVIYVGEGWYKVSVTKLCSPQASINIGATDVPVPGFSYGTVNHTPDGIRNLYLCRPQFEIGETATDYQAVAQPTTNTPLRPAATCNGLLIEEARTNRLLWCRDATQTQWVKTDITAAKDQTGIDGVANAASSLTATADGGTCIQTITLASGSRTGSVYLKRITGTGNVQVSLDGSTWSTVELSDIEWRRIVLSGTVTNPVVGVRLATSGDAVAMDFGQVEDGTFATSPILTTGASATRSADVAGMQDGALFGWYNLSGGTFASTSQLPPFSAPGSVIYTVAALDNVNQFYVWRNSSINIRADSAASPGGASAINIPFSLSSDGALRTAFRVKNHNFALANGNTVLASSNSTINQSMRALLLGRAFNGGYYLNACISRLTFSSAAYSDAAARELST